MKSYVIHLIRHGLTEGNLRGQYVGRTDPPLLPEGAARILELKQKNAYPAAAQVFFTSPLRRCVETLRLIYPEALPTVIDDFRECDFGDWEGKTAAELENDPVFLRWMEDGGKAAPPNGESGAMFMYRVCAAFEKLVESLMRSGTTSAVIVAHGGTIMSILSAYGLPRAHFYDWMTDNGCGYSLRITPGLWMRSMVAEVYAMIPPAAKQADGGQKLVIDLAREAADRAYGKKEEKTP